jgi:diacylglycerol kinase family enzyme
MPSLGAIVNARARGVQRNPRLIEGLRAIPGVQAIATSAPEEVAPALEKLRVAGIDTLLCVGGDGTIAGTLTPLLRLWPHEALPAVALCQGGTVNTIAKSLGADDDVARLARGLAEGRPRAHSHRPAVGVRADEGELHHGLVFVNGVGVRFLEMYYGETKLGVMGAATVVARIAGSALVRGPLARRAFAPFQARLRIDGDGLETRPYTIMGGSSVRHIGLGFAPFWSAGSDPERIHFTTTRANARQIVAALPTIRSGRPSDAFEHYSVKHARIESEGPEPWSLDADVHAPASRIDVSAGPTLDFVSLEA